MKAIVRKRQRRTLVEDDKRELVFTVRDSIVDPQKIDRWMKRNDVPGSFLYAPSPAACKSTCDGYCLHTTTDILKPPLQLYVVELFPNAVLRFRVSHIQPQSSHQEAFFLLHRVLNLSLLPSQCPA